MKTHKIIGAVQFIDDEGRVVGQVVGKAQSHAYAMAAAPEMLAACEAMLTAYRKGDSSKAWVEAICDAKAALAKVRGEEAA